MNLGCQIKGILEFSEGVALETTDKALKETVEYYTSEYLGKRIEEVKKEIEEAQLKKKDDSDKGSLRFYLRVYETRRELLEQIIRGENTFSNILQNINLTYDRKDFHNVILHAFSELLSCSYAKHDECERLDKIVSRIYQAQTK